jgi:UDP-N-acetyl-2-amino-2-deoxyglucuronate dehydrogenase
MKNFAITGAAGYVAPRHLKAIKDTGNKLIAACDPHDSVGILDSYFPKASFFTEIERFDRHLVKMRRFKKEDKIDYLSICSPNYLHDAHIRLALRLDADAICEKPLVLKPSNIEALSELEKESDRKVYNILQLRVHPAIIDLKKQIDQQKNDHKYNITLSYITSRGPWYQYSWKGNHEKSGGIATNIGIHFFDMLIWIFGKVQRTDIFLNEYNKMSGFIELEKANVRWFLSIDRDDLPQSAVDNGYSTFRSITYDGKEIEFTGGFTDLHTMVYQDILDGKGYGLMSALPSIELVYDIRNTELSSINDSAHPFLIK